MDINDYMKEASKQVLIDRLNIEEQQLKLPAYKALWVGRLINHRKELDEFYDLYDDAIINITDKIIKESPFELTKIVAAKQAESHELAKKIKKQIKETKLLIELCEKYEKMFSGISYDIRNAIDLIKMETL